MLEEETPGQAEQPEDSNEVNALKSSITDLFNNFNEANLNNLKTKQTKGNKNEEQLAQIQEDILKKLQQEIKTAQNEYQATVEGCFDKFDKNTTALLSQKKTNLNQEQEQRLPYFAEKEFVNQDSTLTILFKTQIHFRTLYNMAIVTMIFLFISLVLQDYIKNREFSDLENLVWLFSGFIQALGYWAVVVLMSLIVLVLVQLAKYFPSSIKFLIAVYVFLHYFILYFSLRMVWKHELKFGVAMALSCETTRIAMKIHSYFRFKLLYGTENSYRDYLPKMCQNKNLSIKDMNQPTTAIYDIFTEFKNFMHFFFLPTLIYRDSYQFRTSINYKFVLANFLNFWLCIYFSYMMAKAFIFAEIENFKIQDLTLLQAIQLCLKCILPSVVWLIMMFFGFLHSWLNLFAELLRFQDRVFYMDWWNSNEFGSYYRKWNIVVHDWLYQHIYCDIIRFSKDKATRTHAQIATFFYSAVIHEVILTTAIGYFFPLLFIIFTGPGILLIQNKKFNNLKQFNAIFWFLYSVGSGMLITFYFREFYVRQIISDESMHQTFGKWEFFIPRSIAYQFLDFTK